MFPLVSPNCWRKGHSDDKEASVPSMGRSPVWAKESSWMHWAGGEGAVGARAHDGRDHPRGSWASTFTTLNAN